MKLTLIPVFVAMSLVAAANQLPEDRGIAGLKQALDRLDIVGSVLHTGAHPDDEDSSLLAWLSRGRGVRTAYLSATRGEGGQNLIGDEFFEALGVIRTEELLAARRFDKAQQFFTPNYEFGFSKTAAETLEKWGRERLVGDIVRVIRKFRPEVIVSRFSGTPSDGHGHHQAVGIATREAFHSAGDSQLYPEHGMPWQAKKLYQSIGARRPDKTIESDITINVGEYGVGVGRSYHELAMEGRSLHRTQSMGAARERGARYSGLKLIDKTISSQNDSPLFDGVTHKLMDLVEMEPELKSSLEDLQGQIDLIRRKASINSPEDIFPDLIEAILRLKQIISISKEEHVRFLLQNKAIDLHLAAELAAGVTVGVFSSDDSIVPKQSFDLRIIIVNNGPFDFETVRTNTDFPSGWEVEYKASNGSLKSGERFEQQFTVTVADNPNFTQPYWLRSVRSQDRFVSPDELDSMLPFSAPLMPTRIELDFENSSLVINRNAEYRYVDSVYGEIKRLVKVVPELSVSLAPGTAIVPLLGSRKKRFDVAVHSQAPQGGVAEVRLETPNGWSVEPKVQSVRFSLAGETASAQFIVDIPEVTGEFEVAAKVLMGKRAYNRGYRVIAYPHIETRHIYSEARSKVTVFDIDTNVKNIGYVKGAGDRIAESLEQLDIPVKILHSDDLTKGDLSVYDTIVVGIRAYSVREDLRASNERLLDYVKNGGTLVVQYNQYDMPRGNFGPFPFMINRPHDRVTVEEAPVIFVDPEHPVMNKPNKITNVDFEDWVQERGLYFFGEWDSRYKPILSSNDPGEPPKLGGLLVANVGLGHYVYAGYAFFRQLPAGVTGAYRIFSNLISLGN